MKRATSRTMLFPTAVFALFSLWLMWHTFSYDGAHQTILIGQKLWSDFGAHIPLIRSFSMGNNWPPVYPIYPGVPIRYHFLFYFLVGMLEKAGFRIDWALNLPSALGFFLLGVSVYLLGSRLFQSRAVGILGVVFFLFNGSLSYVRFFARHPLSVHTFRDIVENNTFPSFAPWGDGDITAFWNLNIYTNQRHLAFSFFLVMLAILIMLAVRRRHPDTQIWAIIPLTGLFAVLPWFHQPSLIIAGLFAAWFFIVFPSLRRMLLITAVISAFYVVPQLAPILRTGTKQLAWYPGFLIHDSLSLPRFLSYWYQNFGAHFILIPVGFFLAPKRAKFALFPVFFLFLVANLFRFSVEVAASHKFFNFTLLLGSLYTAWAIVWFFRLLTRLESRIVRLLGCIAIAVTVLSLTLSGVIDLFPVANDALGTVSDIKANPAALWISRNTPPDAVFLNSSFFYHPASLAGRRIFIGWPYFAWSAGYTGRRFDDLHLMYESRNPQVFCPMLHENNIGYVTVEYVGDDRNRPQIDVPYFTTRFRPAYEDTKRNFYIYTTESLCP